MIADQLKTQFDVSLDKKKIHLDHPIRALGDHDVELRLHADVVTTLKVRVESTTPPPAPVVAPAAEPKKEEPRTEKRGRRPEGPAPGPEAADKKGRPVRSDKYPRPEKGRKEPSAAGS
jgi:large subunit ribosomal protein L9